MAWQKSCRMPGRASGCYWCYCHVSAAPVPVIVPVLSLPPVQTTLLLPHHSRCSHLLPPLPDPFQFSPAFLASCSHQRRPVPHRVNHRPTDLLVMSLSLSLSLLLSHGKSSVATGCLCTRRESHKFDAFQKLNYCSYLDVSHGAALIGLT